MTTLSNGYEEESIPFSLVAHWMFCPRRAWLELMGEKSPEVAQIAEGIAAHHRVDVPTTKDAVVMRGIDVREPNLGVHGRVDRVEKMSSGGIRLVEHKATPVKLSPTVSEANRVQLTLQTMALEANGFSVEETEVFFTTHHKRVPLEITVKDRQAASEVVLNTRETLSSDKAPQPLIDDPKCMRCSHAAVCLPDERQETAVRRKILVPDPGSEVMHLTVPGSRARLSSGRIIVDRGQDKIATAPIERIAAVVVHGNVDLSGALIRELMWRGTPCVWCTGAGRVVGWTNGVKPPNGGARFRQFEASARGRIDLAQEMIAAKISNQATIFRRFGGAQAVVNRLRNLARETKSVGDSSELFGIEGRAAANYFSEFATLLTPRVNADITESFKGRVGRGATDAINVALNYGYGLLLGEVTRAVLACGLDPHAGILHSHKRNKPALALDLMEEFRAPLVDAAVLTAFNNGELGNNSFTHVLGSARLTQEGRRKLIGVFERRMNTEFTHPVFGYKLTWRRAIEVQVRMFLGVLDGTQPTYTAVRVR